MERVSLKLSLLKLLWNSGSTVEDIGPISNANKYIDRCNTEKVKQNYMNCKFDQHQRYWLCTMTIWPPSYTEDQIIRLSLIVNKIKIVMLN